MLYLIFSGAIVCVAAGVWTVYLRLLHPIEGQRFFRHPNSGKVFLHKAKWSFKGGVSNQDWWAEVRLVGHGAYRMVGLWTKGRQGDAIPAGQEWFYPYQLLTTDQVIELERNLGGSKNSRHRAKKIRPDAGQILPR